MKRFRRTLYVGLGGAGCKTLREIKLRIQESIIGQKQSLKEDEKDVYAQNNMPGQIKFLCVDTNSADLNSLTEFSDEEKLCVSVREAYKRYDREKDNSTYEYIPSSNTKHITALEKGAGQIRSNGHFAVIESQFLGAFTEKIERLANDIREVTIPNEIILDDTVIEVHLVSSLCGGTGSGMFLPISLLIREAIKNCEITAYLYTSSFFKNEVDLASRDEVVVNSYAAIAELDYCMHYGYERNRPITFSFGPSRSQKVEMKQKPFNEVMLIDKQTFVGPNGIMEYTYANIEEVRKITAEMMYLCSTDTMTEHIGIMDNVRQKVSEGTFDIRGKSGWVMGFGISELYIHGYDLMKKTAIQKTIDFLTTFNQDKLENADQTASAWLAECKLDERNEEEDGNHFIDDIHRYMDELRSITIDNISDSPNLKDIYEEVKLKDKKVYENRLKDRQKSIENKIAIALSDGSSFNDLVNILEEFSHDMSLCVDQLRKEITAHEGKLKKIKLGDAPIKDENWILKIIGVSNNSADFERKKQQFINDSYGKLIDFAKYQCEIDRKNLAIDIYEALIIEVNKKKDQFSRWAGKLGRIIECGNDSLKAFNEEAKRQFNHHSNESNNILNTPKGKNKIDLTETIQLMPISNPITTELLQREFDTQGLEDKSVFDNLRDQVLFKLTEKNGDSVISAFFAQGDSDNDHKEKIDKVLKNLLKNSSPMLNIDMHGESFKLDEFNYIVASKDIALKVKELLRSLYTREFDVVEDPDLKDRVLLLRIVGAVPPYFVKGIADNSDPLSMEHVYEVEKSKHKGNTPFSHAALQRLLENKYSVLKPIDEMEEDAVMEIWLNFIIYGFIQRTDYDRYWIESESLGERLSDDLQHREKVLILGDNRVEAYETFRRYCSVLLEDYETAYTERLKKETRIDKEDGKTEYIIDLSSEHYLSDSKCLVDTEHIEALHKNDEEFKLLEKEIIHIDKRIQRINEYTKTANRLSEIISKTRH